MSCLCSVGETGDISHSVVLWVKKENKKGLGALPKPFMYCYYRWVGDYLWSFLHAVFQEMVLNFYVRHVYFRLIRKLAILAY